MDADAGQDGMDRMVTHRTRKDSHSTDSPKFVPANTQQARVYGDVNHSHLMPCLGGGRYRWLFGGCIGNYCKGSPGMIPKKPLMICTKPPFIKYGR